MLARTEFAMRASNVRRLSGTFVHFGILLTVFAVGPAAFGADYTITDLGTLGGASSQSFRMSGSGAVAGFSANSSGSQHAFLYGNGILKDLGTLGGTASQALGINAAGRWSATLI